MIEKAVESGRRTATALWGCAAPALVLTRIGRLYA